MSKPDSEPTARPMAVTRIGRRVPEFVADAEADFEHVNSLLTKARDYLLALEEEARGVNGLSASARGWRSSLDQIIDAAQKEAAEVRKKMTGPTLRDEIKSSVDHEHAGRVRTARET